VHRFYKKDQLFLLHDLYTAEFGPMGYTLQTLFDGVFFVILMTHSTETPDACVQHFTNGGYRPYDLEQARAEATAKAVPKQMPDVKALLAREKALLAELADIRKQMAGC
jgi:hypothetical protein